MSRIILFLIAITIFSCTPAKESNGIRISEIQAPSTGHAEVPRLFSSAAGDVYMSWIEQDEDFSYLKYSILQGNQWSNPVKISEGDNWFVNWADFPSIIAGDGYLTAHWLQKRDQGTYDYDVQISTSTNGVNWSESFIPHKDELSAEHGFVSMLPMENGQFFATWLDGRNTKSEGNDHGNMEHSGAMTLRAGIFDIEGNTLNEWELDDRTCDCCQTTAVMTKEGPMVIYRDRSMSEVRDIYSTKLVAGKWTEPNPVAIDLWEIAGCPVNGPAAAISNDVIGVAHFSAAGNTPRVSLSLSYDNGDSFEKSITIAEGNTLGRVGISALKDERFAVSWLKTEGDLTLIMLSQYDLKGNLIGEYELSKTGASRASGFPVITEYQDQIIAAWTLEGEHSIIKTASLNLD